MSSSLGSMNPNSMTPAGSKQPRISTLGNLVDEEFIVNDKVFATSTPPQIMAASSQQQTVWVSYADGGLEVRNARTAEVIRRFSAEAVGGNGNILSSGTTRRSAFLALDRPAGPHSEGLRRLGGSGGVAVPAHVVHSMMAVPATTDADAEAGDDEACGAVETMWLGLSNGSIEVYNAVTCTFHYGLRKHVGPVLALAQFGGLAYSAGQDQRIIQWRVRDGRYIRFMHTAHGTHEGPIRCLYAEGNALVSGSDDNTVKVWDVGSGELQLTGYFHSQSGGVLCLTRVGEHMWSGDRSGQIIVWGLHTCEAVRIAQPHEAAVLALRRIGARVYSGSADGHMGIFDSATGTLLHKVDDQSRGWVTSLAWPSQLSRFVVWSADANGLVRCWYQDEHATITGDFDSLSEPTWYLSGSTPYREFRASLVRRNAQLREKLAASEVRERSTMGLLRRCSRVFGGGAGGDGQGDIGYYTAKLKDQLRLAGERCDKAERDIQRRKEEVAQVERDMAATLQMLQSSRDELNRLSPGAVDRLAAILPTIPPEAYTSAGLVAPPPPPASANTTGVPPPVAPTTTTTTAPPPPGSVPVPDSSAPVPPPPMPPQVPTPATLPVMAPLPQPNPVTDTATAGSPLGIGGAPPPLPPGCGVGLAGGAGVPPPPAVAVPPPPPPLSQPAPAPTAPAPTAPTTGYDYYAQLGILPPAATLATTLASSGVVLPVAGAGPTVAGAGASAAAALTSAKLSSRRYSGAQWTNPNVGNYIQRRYYGASPSLRTTDIHKRESRRQRMPTIPVEPLKAEQRQRAGSRHSRSVSATSQHSGHRTVADKTSVSSSHLIAATTSNTVVTTSSCSGSPPAHPPPPSVPVSTTR